MKRLLVRLLNWIDAVRFDLWAARPNGSQRLQAIHQCVLDAADSLEAVCRALDDGDTEEAKRLLALAHDSLSDHLNELKGLL